MDISFNNGVSRAIALSRTGLQPGVVFFPTDSKSIIFSGREYGYEALAALWRFKGSVDNYLDLPSTAEAYDVYNCINAAGSNPAGYYQYLPSFHTSFTDSFLNQPAIYHDTYDNSFFGIINDEADPKVKWCDANGNVYTTGNATYYLRYITESDGTRIQTTTHTGAGINIITGIIGTSWHRVGIPDLQGYATMQQLTDAINGLDGDGLSLHGHYLEVNVGEGLYLDNDDVSVLTGAGMTIGASNDLCVDTDNTTIGINGSQQICIKPSAFAANSDIEALF